jgi:GntR family transcriptional regulator
MDQIKAAAASGVLKPGEPLPSIRAIAEELQLNRNTVAKAYSELESLGVLDSHQGRGCFLRPNHSPLKKDARRKLLIEEIDQVVVQAHHLDIPSGDLLQLVRERAKDFEEQRLSHAESREGSES